MLVTILLTIIATYVLFGVGFYAVCSIIDYRAGFPFSFSPVDIIIMLVWPVAIYALLQSRSESVF